MTVHGVMLPRAVSAMNVDSLTRNAKIAADIDNGWCVSLSGLTGTSGEGEVFTAVQPATATLAALWMADGEGIVLSDGKYKGINPNVRDFYTPSGKVFTVFKPQVGDIISLTAECLGGTKSSNGFVVGTNADYKLNWAAAAISGLSLKLLATDYLSLPLTGAIAEVQRQDIYRFEVVAVA